MFVRVVACPHLLQFLFECDKHHKTDIDCQKTCNYMPCYKAGQESGLCSYIKITHEILNRIAKAAENSTCVVSDVENCIIDWLHIVILDFF